MKKIVLAYVPVLHEGYRRFFDKYKGAKLILLGDEIKEKFVPLVKDIRALPVDLIKKSIETWGIFSTIKVANIDYLKKVSSFKEMLVVPDEDIMHELRKQYFSKFKKVEFDTIFLRWDKHKSTAEQAVDIDQKISKEKFDKDILKLLASEAKKSSDFWRGIGAAIIKNKKVILKTHNRHVPSEHTPYVNGDPRSDFHKGINIEISTAIHAEAYLISQSAEKGIVLKGASMYVSTFPCPPCAKLIAYSGIKKLYYRGGYGVLDAESILKSRGVEIIFVDKD